MLKKEQKVKIKQDIEFNDGDEEINILKSFPELECLSDERRGLTTGYVLVGGAGFIARFQSWRLEEAK